MLSLCSTVLILVIPPGGDGIPHTSSLQVTAGAPEEEDAFSPSGTVLTEVDMKRLETSGMMIPDEGDDTDVRDEMNLIDVGER